MTDELRAKRQALISELWRWHAEVCDCRATDGGRCEVARAIIRVDLDLRELEAVVMAE